MQKQHVFQLGLEWNDNKATSNYEKHGIRFSEAVTIWQDENSLEIFDANHSQEEERWIRLGISQKLKVLVVVFIEKFKEDKIRIISARRANKNETKQYMRPL